MKTKLLLLVLGFLLFALFLLSCRDLKKTRLKTADTTATVKQEPVRGGQALVMHFKKDTLLYFEMPQHKIPVIKPEDRSGMSIILYGGIIETEDSTNVLINMLLIDPQGRKKGRDQNWIEYVGYVIENQALNIDYSKPPEGNYQLQVFGYDMTYYRLEFLFYDENAKLMQSTFRHVPIKKGEKQTYIFHFYKKFKSEEMDFIKIPEQAKNYRKQEIHLFIPGRKDKG